MNLTKSRYIRRSQKKRKKLKQEIIFFHSFIILHNPSRASLGAGAYLSRCPLPTVCPSSPWMIQVSNMTSKSDKKRRNTHVNTYFIRPNNRCALPALGYRCKTRENAMLKRMIKRSSGFVGHSFHHKCSLLYVDCKTSGKAADWQLLYRGSHLGAFRSLRSLVPLALESSASEK